MSPDVPAVPQGPTSPDRKFTDLRDSLGRVVGDVQEVNAVYRLVDPADEAVLDEFYSKQLQHLIRFDKDGDIARRHRFLQEKGVRTFSNLEIGKHALLVVPEGAKSIQNLLPVLSRDANNQSSVFESLGYSLRRIEAAGAGLPPIRGILGHFALAASTEARKGSELYFLPPYDLGVTVTRQDILLGLVDELEQVGVDTDARTIAYEGVDRGWNTIG